MAHYASRAQLARVNVWLADTGPLVAYLDPDDPSHTEVSEAVDGFSGSLASTGAVITEAMHFLAGSPGGPGTLAELVSRSGMAIYDVCQPADLRAAARLMERYADTPMDFADATLVLLAEAIETYAVLTLDRRGFATYRTEGGKAFRSVLDLL